MGVYIKGMRMPKGCYDPTVAPSYCFLLTSGTCRSCHEYADEYGELCTVYPQGCPLVEVKEPHGRLIDADNFQIEGVIQGTALHFELGMAYALGKLDDAPTVIERESE